MPRCGRADAVFAVTERYIGIMSGTSVDGIDAALVDFDGDDPTLVDACSFPFPEADRNEALRLVDDDHDDLNRAFRLANRLTEHYARAVAELRARHPGPVRAVGCHGQTLRHFPADPHTPFTVQVVNGAMLAVRTALPCITDFRNADLALGGQGAPLAPGFHAACLRSGDEDRVILNLGGIANVTVLPADHDAAVIGFDTGPANALMDRFAHRHSGANCDLDGRLALAGQASPALLARWLADPYFALPPPKSTGREYFGDHWLERGLAGEEALPAADVQATLLELSACSVADAIECHAPPGAAVYACGGGCRNPALMGRLAERLAPARLADTGALGVDPSLVEAMAFAWLASRRMRELPGNLPSVTGARRAAVLGALYLP